MSKSLILSAIGILKELTYCKSIEYLPRILFNTLCERGSILEPDLCIRVNTLILGTAA